MMLRHASQRAEVGPVSTLLRLCRYSCPSNGDLVVFAPGLIVGRCWMARCCSIEATLRSWVVCFFATGIALGLNLLLSSLAWISRLPGDGDGDGTLLCRRGEDVIECVCLLAPWSTDCLPMIDIPISRS